MICRGSKPRRRPAHEGWNVPIAAEHLKTKRNAVAWAPDQRRMNQNANHATVWSPDQRLIQTKFIERRL
jgi:hypothetical protein